MWHDIEGLWMKFHKLSYLVRSNIVTAYSIYSARFNFLHRRTLDMSVYSRMYQQ